jgi:hypothetical protein
MYNCVDVCVSLMFNIISAVFMHILLFMNVIAKVCRTYKKVGYIRDAQIFQRPRSHLKTPPFSHSRGRYRNQNKAVWYILRCFDVKFPKFCGIKLHHL